MPTDHDPTEATPAAGPPGAALAETIPTHYSPVTGRLVQRRYPIAPVLARMAELDVSAHELARRLGYRDDDSPVWRVAREGATVAMADRLALALGTFPHHLWPTWHADAHDDAATLCGHVEGIAEHWRNRDTLCATCAAWAATGPGAKLARRYYLPDGTRREARETKRRAAA